MSLNNTQQQTLWTIPFLLGTMWFGLQLSKEHRLSFDLSAQSEYGVSVAMQQLLSELSQREQQLEIIAFRAQPSRKDALMRDQYLEDLLQQLARTSSSVSWRFADLDRDRNLAQALEVKQYGTVVLRIGEVRESILDRNLFVQNMGRQEVHFVGEDVLQQRIRDILYPTKHMVYTLNANGERSLFDGGSAGLSQFHALVENQGAAIRNLNLLQRDAVPEDASLVMVMEPTSILPVDVQQRLLKYITGGGRVWFASPFDYRTLFAPLQVEALDGVVVEPRTQSGYWDRPILNLQNTEAVLTEFDSTQSVVMTRTNAFSLGASAQSGLNQIPFAGLSGAGWLERDAIDSLEDVPSFEETTDWKGSAGLVVGIQVNPSSAVLKQNVTNAKVLLMGDADWLSNGMFAESAGNAHFAESLLNWMFEKEAVAITKYRKPNRLLITQPQLDRLRWAIIPLPMFFAFLGVLAWRKRR